MSDSNKEDDKVEGKNKSVGGRAKDPRHTGWLGRGPIKPKSEISTEVLKTEPATPEQFKDIVNNNEIKSTSDKSNIQEPISNLSEEFQRSSLLTPEDKTEVLKTEPATPEQFKDIENNNEIKSTSDKSNIQEPISNLSEEFQRSSLLTPEDKTKALTTESKNPEHIEDIENTANNNQNVIKQSQKVQKAEIPLGEELPNGSSLKASEDKDMSDIVALSTLSVLAPEFIPQGAIRQRSYTEIIVQDVGEMKVVLENSLSICHSALKVNPAAFDEVVFEVLPELLKCFKNQTLLEVIANQLLVDTLLDPSYAYLAVGIYCLYISEIANMFPGEDNIARHVIVKLCESQIDQVLNEQLKPSTSEDAQHCNVAPFLMFLGELYLQLEEGGNRLSLLGVAIIDICKGLMKADWLPFEKRLWDILAVMKLTGRCLDEVHSVGMNELLGPLWCKMYDNQDKISKSTYKQVNDFIQLRYADWIAPSTSSSETEASEIASVDQQSSEDVTTDAPVCYGPDGQIIDREQELFLNSSGPYLLNVNPSMDDEMISAYEEFVRDLTKE